MIRSIPKILWLLPLLCTLITGSLTAQPSENPFEIKSRLGQMPESTGPAAADMPTGNPFDIIAPLPTDTANTVTTARPASPVAVDPSSLPASQELFILGTVLVLVLLFTILITLLRPYFVKVIRSIANDLMMSQSYREYEQGQGGAYLILYAMFLINAGVFVFLLLRKVVRTELPYSNMILLLICIGGVIILFLLKHLLLRFVRSIFPVEKEIRLYNFSIIVFNAFLGFGLLLANLSLALASDTWQKPTLIAASVFVILVYALRSFWGLLLGGRYLALYTFHFLLYICTAEIAPVMIIGKLIYNQLSA